jgi:aryl-alcohol dehydrogenase-like predicted oxidoreductase
MRKRRLGKNGPMVSEIGLGCMSFAGFYGSTSEAESHETLAAALDLGIDFLDTANVYGMGVSENVIGSFLRKHPAKFKIATKASIDRDPETNKRRFNNSPEHLRSELEKSLKRMGVDYVDLFYIHRREQERPIEAVMETMVRFKEEGMIGGVGFSEISPASLRLAHAVHPVMAVQSEYSLWTRLPDLGMIQACEELGVTFVAFSPVGRGVFGAKPLHPSEFPDSDFRKSNPRFVEPNFSRNVAAIKPFKQYAADMNVSPATLALAWILHRGNHIIPIPGTRTADHLHECAAASGLDLSADQLAEIDRILPVGFAHGPRYSPEQFVGPANYC